jgi:hypothetical protein
MNKYYVDNDVYDDFGNDDKCEDYDEYDDYKYVLIDVYDVCDGYL